MDEATNVKATWLRAFARGSANSTLVGPIEIANLLPHRDRQLLQTATALLPRRSLPKQALLN
jgi:hypothetical protein